MSKAQQTVNSKYSKEEINQLPLIGNITPQFTLIRISHHSHFTTIKENK